MPGRYESSGYVLLEATAAEVPILTTPVGYASDLTAGIGRGAIAIDRDDPLYWSKALDQTLNADQDSRREQSPGSPTRS